MDYFSDTWNVIDTYFKTNPYFLTKHHLESWNDFVNSKITNTIKVLNPFVVLKNQDNGNIVHEINVYIGGLSGEEVFINKPTIYENGEQRVMYPNEARIRDLTYQTEVFANILVKFITRDGNTETIQEVNFNNIKIGAFPIMLHSKLCGLQDQPFDVLKEMGECPYDQGGYFIIDGKEKVIVAQERIALNKIFINKSKDDRFSYEALVRSTSEENPLFPKTLHIYVIKENLKYSYTKKTEKGLIPNSIIITCPNFNKPIPLFIIFRALGIESDKNILEYILYNIDDTTQHADALAFLRYSILAGNKVLSQNDALEYLKSHTEYNSIDKVRYVLVHDFFPNMGHSFRNKALFLGHLVNRLVKVVLGMIPESDRDNYIFKRVDISGFLVGNLFRDYYNQFRNTVRSFIDREYLYGPWRSTKDISHLINKTNINNIFKYRIIEDGFKKSLKGSWGKSMVDESQDQDDIKEGLVQDLARISYMGFMSHLRRVNTPIDPTSKIVAPHRLHPSQWGVMCPIESPDGASIGLLKHFAVFCHVTFESGTEPILQILKRIGVVFIDDMSINTVLGSTKVLVNSNWIGIYEDAPVLYRVLKLLKRNGFMNKYVSISWDIINMEVNISTEAGRCCRPLYVVKDAQLIIARYIKQLQSKKLKWEDLLVGTPSTNRIPQNILDEKFLKDLEENQAPIEYLDVEETNCSMIAMDAVSLTKNTHYKYTHCEIHPSVIFSVVSQNIPLLNHNQAPRNIFFGAQGKQAVGTFSTSFNKRIDTMAYVLNYPQKQLVTTKYKEYLYNNVLTGGENLIVAIATWTGYNQEDSIIVNKSAIERGMFNMTYFKNIIDKESENKREFEKIVFVNPLKLVEEGAEVEKIKFAKYKTLNHDGLPHLNIYIGENDAIIGKALMKEELVNENNKITNNLQLFGNRVKKNIYQDKSLIADKTVSGIVDKVFVYNDVENTKTCKIRLRKTRIPELGDKMASTHGQKGVVGMILPAVNMPFNKDGITPDIIINPHAFPTRMTIGHLLECILSKTSVYEGMMVDATPFNNYDFKSVYEVLETKYGMEKYGNEMLYNGRTGEQIPTEIFFGPTYYQRLKHMVSDKMNYRMTGPRTVTTRQPTQGRGNNGGLRIGEMERDSILSHGMSSFLKESLMERSDKYSFDFEKSTGAIAITNKKEGLFKPLQDDNSYYSTVETPYAFKLFLQEITAMGVKPMLSTEPIDEEVGYDDYEAYDVDDEESDTAPDESDV
jgi:DNA-directed RNA polymerase II subunit RPB2